MKLIQLIFCILFFSAMAQAQTKESDPVTRYFFHSHGISFQKFENLNKRIVSNPQYAPLKNSTGTLQFGLFAERKKLITAYSLNVGSSLSGKKDTKSTATSFLGLSADVGYAIFKTKRVSLYPFAGLGYERYKAVFNRDISALPFDSVLQSNSFQQRAENLVFYNSFIVYRLGGGMIVSSKKHVHNSFGLQVSYTGGFGEQEWRINKTQSLLNSPKDKLAKLSASILFRYQL